MIILEEFQDGILGISLSKINHKFDNGKGNLIEKD